MEICMLEQVGPPACAVGKEELFASLYDELRRIAQRELRRNGSPLTLGATTLLHEAYLNMQQRQGIAFTERAAFLAYASRAMRGLIIDYARNRQALKRGAGFEITSLPTEVSEPESDADNLQRLSDAIERLSEIGPRLAQVVDLKYFGGFSFIEIAAMWGVSTRTVQRDWEKARLYLHRSLSEPDLP
jgi:RNA polymerase sigma factor (TIGR02999 family)